MNLQHATKTQLLERFRGRFATTTQHEVWRLAAFVKSLINAGDVTVAELRAAFNLNVNQINVLAAKLDGYATRYYELKSAAGE